MAKLPGNSRFDAGDYPDAPEFLGQFFDELNPSYSQLVGALDGQLTRGDNLQGYTYTGKERFRVATGASLALDAAPFPLYVPIRQNTLPKILAVGKVDTQGATTLPTSAVQCMWEVASDGKRLKVRYVTGLAINSTYLLTLWTE